MQYRTRENIFFCTTYFLSFVLFPILSTLIGLAAIGKGKQKDSIEFGLLMEISSLFIPRASMILQSIARNRRVGASLRSSVCTIALMLALDQALAGITSKIYCNTDIAPADEGCEKVGPLLFMAITLLANLSLLTLMWPLAKWTLPTPAEVAEEARAREDVSANPGRPAERLTKINQLPNSEVVVACPITHDLPKDPVRFTCPSGDFEDPAGNRVSTKEAFEREVALAWLNQHADCPLTRRIVTGLVPATDVLNREEPAADDSLSEPLLPGETDLEAGSYRTFAPGGSIQ